MSETTFFGGEFFETKFDKGDLKHELKHAGFEDCIADDIVERVNDRKIVTGLR